MKKRFKRKNFHSKSYVKIPSALLEMKQDNFLTGNDITVCAFLLSVKSAAEAVNGFRGIQVSRERIAMRCGITSRTVGNILKKLESINLIQIYRDEWNGKRQSNVYVIGEPLLDLSGGFFYVPRKIFKKSLSPKLLLIYFFLCHAQNYEYSRSWNSYSDMARRLHMNRAEVIKLIGKLEGAGYITKKRRVLKERGKGNCFTDNRYTVLWLLFFTEKNSGQINDRRASSLFIFYGKVKTKIKKHFLNIQYSIKHRQSQAICNKKLEYEISVALLHIQQLEGEQLQLSTVYDTPLEHSLEEYYKDFPF